MSNNILERTPELTVPLSPSEVLANLNLKLRDKNQLVSFGIESDFADAAHIRAILVQLARRYKTHEAKAYSQARGMLVDEWQEARLPAVRHTHNKPVEYPWSKTARDLFFAGDTSNTLVLEHVVPADHLVKKVLFPAVEDPDFTDQMMLDLLIKEHSGLIFTVISKAEDRIIDSKKLRNVHIESDDGWARYKEAGLDTSTFMALIDDDRFDPVTMLKTRGGKIKLVPPLARAVSA